MRKKLDPIEQEYEQAISYARNSDEAYELSIGLRQYRELYKDRFAEMPYPRTDES